MTVLSVLIAMEPRPAHYLLYFLVIVNFICPLSCLNVTLEYVHAQSSQALWLAPSQARRDGECKLGPLLSCGKPCYAQLPVCPHLCEAPCHLRACSAASNCQAGVTVCPC